MRAQTEAASVILITGIILALVAVTYFWGTPLINKQTTASDVSTGTRFLRDVSDRLAELANAGSGSFTVPIPVGSFKVVAWNKDTDGAAGPDEDANTISLELPSTITPLFPQGKVYLDAENYADLASKAGTYGSATHNILSMSARPFGSAYLINITSKERELDTLGIGEKGFLIRLKAPPGEQIAYGKTRVTFKVVNTFTDPAIKAVNGGDLLVTEIEVNPG